MCGIKLTVACLLCLAVVWSETSLAHAGQSVQKVDVVAARPLAGQQAARGSRFVARRQYSVAGAEPLVAVETLHTEPPQWHWVGPLDRTPIHFERDSNRARVMAVDLSRLKRVSSYGVVPRAHLATRPVRIKHARAEVRHWCRAMAERLQPVHYQPCLGDNFVSSGYHSVLGRPIVVRTIQSQQRTSAGRILLIGGTHGDELSSVSLVFKWLAILLHSNTRYTWHVAPSLNPDGLLAKPPQRVNADGVDLNRNLPTTDWETESRHYWHKVGYEPRRYPGTEPASEPETQWLVDEIAAFRPDAIISVHAPLGVLDYNGHLPAPQHVGHLGLHRLGVYPGSLGNYASRMLGIPVITIELRDAWGLPSNTQIRRMWQDLTQWLTAYVGQRSHFAGAAEWPDHIAAIDEEVK